MEPTEYERRHVEALRHKARDAFEAIEIAIAHHRKENTFPLKDAVSIYTSASDLLQAIQCLANLKAIDSKTPLLETNEDG
jgi:transcriptional antiterminator Rof (Rho-off)